MAQIVLSRNQTRLCACDCGTPVRRRFAPGHDQKLVHNLVTAVESRKLDRNTAIGQARQLSPALARRVRHAIGRRTKVS